ncbi:hypothetical protein [Sunxiuqinia indica]|nr:hypothetical protein [Sunxiuqinia indica]
MNQIKREKESNHLQQNDWMKRSINQLAGWMVVASNPNVFVQSSGLIYWG